MNALTVENLSAGYRSGDRKPTDVVADCLRRIEAHADPAIWIELFPPDQIMAQARSAEARIASGDPSRLLGIPFAIKDNIDVAGHATTAACPDFAYRPERSATVVQKLLDAGAIAFGKTNLDQLATGLVGTRSPYGAPRNPFGPNYIPGGSSSGSAVAVAAGLVSFALGTDTAGSGRVPAGFNNIVGLKPTCGRFSTSGVVPACRSIDCVSVFALTCADAAEVMEAASGYDPDDPYSRRDDQIPLRPRTFPARFRFGVPGGDQLKFFGNQDAEALYHQAVERLIALGGQREVIDFTPFADAGSLLYQGAWVAERLAGLRKLVDSQPESLLPVTRGILQSARKFDAVSAFDCLHNLRVFHRQAARQWEKMDLLLLPTTGTIYTVAEIENDPLSLNSNLGYYTTFTNLLDLCGVAIPSGIQKNGLPAGVTLMAPPGYEPALLDLGGKMHSAAGVGTGAGKHSLPRAHAVSSRPPRGFVKLAVVGAHLSGQPLNHQLTNLNGRLVRTCNTAPLYHLFALAETKPPKPGLIRTTDSTGAAIEVEVWELTPEAFGRFVAAIPPPMGICTVRLEDGEEVKGFLSETCVTAGAKDITSFGGWRKYLATL